MEIKFTLVRPIAAGFEPYPAGKKLPEWFKQTTTEVPDADAFTPNAHSIKACMPVFDSLSAGYIIPTYTDVKVVREKGSPVYSWRDFSPIEAHAISQADKHPHARGPGVAKWSNPWSIQTSRGTSCLFVPPLNRDSEYFSCLPGIVDTDNYINPVNFPFFLSDPKWEGIIPAGTPMVQVIPFRRDSWKSSVCTDINSSPRSPIRANLMKLNSLLRHSYRRQFWQRKQYR